MAWVERYVRADADGAGDGTTDANSGATGSWTWAQFLTTAAPASAHRVNMKAGTYTLGNTNDIPANAGTAALPGFLRGYNTTIGDIDTDNTLTKPVLSWGTGRIIPPNYWIFQNLDMSGANTAATFDPGASVGIQVDRCRVANSSTGFAIDTSAGGMLTVTRSWLNNTSTGGVVRSRAPVRLIGCTLKGGTDGLTIATTAAVPVAAIDCAFKGQSGDGIRVTVAGELRIVNCSFSTPGSDGIEMTVACDGVIANCIFNSAGGWGINNSSGANVGGRVHRVGNVYFGNTSGKETGFGDAPSVAEVTDSAASFVSSTDLTLASTSGARSAAIPGVFENETYTTYGDRGAVRHIDPSGSGGGGAFSHRFPGGR